VILRLKNSKINKLQEEFFHQGGARAPPKLPLFVIANFLSCQKKAISFPLCQPTIGAHGGTGKSARQGVDLANVSRPSAEQAYFLNKSRRGLSRRMRCGQSEVFSYYQ